MLWMSDVVKDLLDNITFLDYLQLYFNFINSNNLRRKHAFTYYKDGAYLGLKEKRNWHPIADGWTGLTRFSGFGLG